MMKDNKLNAFIVFGIGLFILKKGTMSIAPGVPLELGNYKYLVFLLFLFISITLLKSKQSED